MTQCIVLDTEGGIEYVVATVPNDKITPSHLDIFRKLCDAKLRELAPTYNADMTADEFLDAALNDDSPVFCYIVRTNKIDSPL